MKRWHEDYPRTHREWKKAYLHQVKNNIEWGWQGTIDPYDVPRWATQKGRFRKRDAQDCGHTQCYVCHSDKVPKRTKTRQELISDQNFTEGLIDLQSGRSVGGKG